jgi:hypothetical protein
MMENLMRRKGMIGVFGRHVSSRGTRQKLGILGYPMTIYRIFSTGTLFEVEGKVGWR